jgi:hypothetical protein
MFFRYFLRNISLNVYILGKINSFYINYLLSCNKVIIFIDENQSVFNRKN